MRRCPPRLTRHDCCSPRRLWPMATPTAPTGGGAAAARAAMAAAISRARSFCLRLQAWDRRLRLLAWPWPLLRFWLLWRRFCGWRCRTVYERPESWVSDPPQPRSQSLEVRLQALHFCPHHGELWAQAARRWVPATAKRPRAMPSQEELRSLGRAHEVHKRNALIRPGFEVARHVAEVVAARETTPVEFFQKLLLRKRARQVSDHHRAEGPPIIAIHRANVATGTASLRIRLTLRHRRSVQRRELRCRGVCENRPCLALSLPTGDASIGAQTEHAAASACAATQKVNATGAGNAAASAATEVIRHTIQSPT